MKGGIVGIVLVALLALWGTVALGAAETRQVYLKDGGVVESQSVWRNDGKVMVLVNRDTLVELAADEVDLKRTFGTAAVKRTAKKRVKAPDAVEVTPVSEGGATPAAQAAPAPEKPRTASVAETDKSQQPSAAPGPAVGAAPTPAPPAPQPPPAPAPKITVVPAPEIQPAVVAMPAMFGTGFLVVWVLVMVFILATFWKLFEKAGEAGWKSLVPLYNLFVMVKIAGKPWWWFLLMFLPVVNVAIAILLHVALAARFGKGPLFGLGLVFFGFIFFPMLAFGKAEYT
jgi:hypothetical protein